MRQYKYYWNLKGLFNYEVHASVIASIKSILMARPGGPSTFFLVRVYDAWTCIVFLTKSLKHSINLNITESHRILM